MASTEISKSKKIVFTIISVLLPVIALILLEITLRIFGYGYNSSLFIDDPKHPGYVYMNPEASKKYFSIQKNATVGLYEPFTKKKQRKTYRIFVLGGSTALGFPYYQSGSFHRLLLYRLQRTFPDKDIEIINLALTAVNSYTVLDFARQVVNYQPDAVLIYMGHNEYYGAMGVGSTSGWNYGVGMGRIILYLRQFRTVQLLSDLIYKFRKIDPGTTDLKRTLMERMAKGHVIKPGSEKYEKGLEQFDRNLTSVLSILHKKHIKVFCSNLVCNLKDQPPLISLEFPKKPLWKDYYTSGCKFDSIGNVDSAYVYYSKANQIDSSIAICNYKMAKAAYTLGRFSVAKREFENAKENDLLKFRAPEKINEIIHDRSAQFSNVYFVNALQYFDRYSPHQIVGKELITEHLHPNLKGYWVLSMAFYDALKKDGGISTDWSGEIPVDQMYAELPLTKVDSLYGAYKVLLLHEQWPFYGKRVRRDTTGLSFEEKVAGGMVVNTIGQRAGMEALFNYYMKNKQFREALKLYESQIPDMPFNKVNAYTLALDLAERIKDYKLAVFYGLRGFHVSPGFKFGKALFINFLKLDLPDKALPYIDFVIKNNPTQINFTPLRNVVDEIIGYKSKLKTDPSNLEYLNGIAEDYKKIGNFDVANKYFDKSTSSHRNYPKTNSSKERNNVKR